MNSAQYDPFDPNVPADAEAQLEKLRDILFGRERAALEARLQTLETRFTDEMQALRGELAQQLEQIRSEVTALQAGEANWQHTQQGLANLLEQMATRLKA